MNCISYWAREWHTGTRYRNEELVGKVLDPQPPKPLWRPGWQISFLWTGGEKKQGTIWQAQRDTEETWYSVKVEGEKNHHVKEADILKRIED